MTRPTSEGFERDHEDAARAPPPAAGPAAGTRRAADRPGEDVQEPDPAIQSLTAGEEQDALERAGPRAPVVYASISSRGLEEINRPAVSLIGSGLSAGIIMTTSVIAQGLFHLKLPQFGGRELVADLGYTVGFMIVILGRLQLFTENTITPVLPLLASPSRRAFRRTARLWGLVLAANLLGTLLASALLLYGDIVTDEQLAAILEVSHHVLDHTAFETLRFGVIAGVMIAALVWILPQAGGSSALLIFFVTYVIALGDFTHVIAGSAESFLLMLNGDASATHVLLGVVAPALVGNVLGGTVLFATLAYVQVMEEISADKRRAQRPLVERAPRPRGIAPSKGP